MIDASGNNPQITVFDIDNMVIRSSLTEGSSDKYKHIVSEYIMLEVISFDISEWGYIVNKELKAPIHRQSVNHARPMVESFKDAFGLSAIEKSVASLDSSEVIIRAIKELNNKLEVKDVCIARLDCFIDLLSPKTELVGRTEMLEASLTENGGITKVRYVSAYSSNLLKTNQKRTV